MGLNDGYHRGEEDEMPPCHHCWRKVRRPPCPCCCLCRSLGQRSDGTKSRIGLTHAPRGKTCEKEEKEGIPGPYKPLMQRTESRIP